MLKSKVTAILFLGACHALHEHIIEGKKINIKDAPYQVSLQSSLTNDHLCGGSILSRRWILTAGHCQMSDNNPIDKHVIVGMTKRSKGGLVHTIKRAIRHPEFGSLDTNSHDIALLELNKPIKLNVRAQPIRLPSDGQQPPIHASCKIQGWGFMSAGAVNSNHLTQTTLPMWEPVACAKVFDLDKKLFVGDDATLLCAGWYGRPDACSVDAGSPLTYHGVQYGISSYGMACSNPDYPKVFANVYNLRDFIYEHTDVKGYVMAECHGQYNPML